ncbi:hypothetical protein ACA910_004467 [Epithemia clementina (nom. ined.)]
MRNNSNSGRNSPPNDDPTNDNNNDNNKDNNNINNHDNNEPTSSYHLARDEEGGINRKLLEPPESLPGDEPTHGCDALFVTTTPITNNKSPSFVIGHGRQDDTNKNNNNKADLGDEWMSSNNSNTTFHAFCGRMVTSAIFQHVILGLILFNSILTALETFDFVRNNPQLTHQLDALDTILLTAFTAELGLNLYYHGLARFFSNGWLVFDFIVVTTSWAFAAMTVLRSFRIIRTVRFVTHLRDIQQLVEALWSVVPRMFAIFAFLLLIYFVYAVLLTELFHSAYEDGITSEDHFSRLDVTAFTLMQFMFMDDWSGTTKELMAVYYWAWIPILSFIIICTFVVVNLMIAVICDAVQALQTDEMTSQIEVMQSVTTTAIQKAHKLDSRERVRLEAKLDEILRILATANLTQAQLSAVASATSSATPRTSPQEQQPSFQQQPSH